MVFEGVKILGSIDLEPRYGPSKTTQADILTKSALEFIVILHRTFNSRRKELLELRRTTQTRIDKGEPLAAVFTDELSDKIRGDPTWLGSFLGRGMEDRRSEITGPPERKMLVNALNSAVKTYMTDFEDSLSPSWNNLVQGQVNLYDAVREEIDFVNSDNGKEYKVNRSPGRHVPVILVRPRGWHMVDKHLYIDNEPISASLFDFGLYFFHNAKELIKRGFGPYFYLPKMQHHLEAKLWNDVFNVAQDYLQIPRGTIRATVLVETLPAAYQMEEIIFQLRNHSAGLNCGRWDYIFSTIKTLRASDKCILPDRDQVTMTVPFMEAYCKTLINICHRRQVHAMGGMAAQIPIKNDEEANALAMKKVENDKLREALMHYDGTWVAHPALASIANDVFNKYMITPNQIHIVPPAADPQELSNTEVKGGKITLSGIRQNIYIALCYVEAWISGSGCSPINNLMEDAATAEVSRLQLYSWVQHAVKLADTNEVVTSSMIETILNEEVSKLEKTFGEKRKFATAAKLLKPDICGESLADFVTCLMYDEIVTVGDEVSIDSLKE